MFIDKVTVQIKAGDGGDGYVSFRNEKYVEKGGPDGGDGGNGGDVVVIASRNQNTLSSYRYDKRVTAQNGKAGFRRNMHGKSAPALEVPLPIGTVVTDTDGHVRADLREEGQRVVIAHGGKGGFGNAHFVSSTRQAPRFAEKGEPGDAFEAVFEIKMIADAGLVGLPNAGKSTFLSAVTNATPEIADYPFTTLTPNLGVAPLPDGPDSILFADIPGLIEGASEGKGLGDAFLKHIERTAVIVHCLDAYSADIAADYKIIREELARYSKALAAKPELVLLTKIEGLDADIVEMQKSELQKNIKKTTQIFPISSHSKEGIHTALWAIDALVKKQRKTTLRKKKEELPVIQPDFSEQEWSIKKLDDQSFCVLGAR